MRLGPFRFKNVKGPLLALETASGPVQNLGHVRTMLRDAREEPQVIPLRACPDENQPDAPISQVAARRKPLGTEIAPTGRHTSHHTSKSPLHASQQ